MAANVNWTAQYNFTNTPEANGFTRLLVGDGAINLQTTGPPSGRNISVVTGPDGQGVLTTSQIPAFDDSLGATGEAIVSVNGAGDAGFEIDLLHQSIAIQVFQDSLMVTYLTSPTSSANPTFATASNTTPTTWRMTISGSRELNVYRNAVLIAGPITLVSVPLPFQKFLWWGEAGGTFVFTEMAYYIGGPVAPG